MGDQLIYMNIDGVETGYTLETLQEMVSTTRHVKL